MSKTKIELQLNELVELGKEWIAFAASSVDAYGWDYERHNAKCTVACYFAHNSDHTAVKFGKIHIGFHAPPVLEITIQELADLDTKIKNYRQLLATERRKETIKSKQEVNAEKAARKLYLERELENL